MRTQKLIHSFRKQWSAWRWVVVTWLTLPANIFAQSSLLDSSFTVGSGVNGSVYSILLQNDGKILVGGEFTQISGQSCSNLARLNSDGRLDESFAGGTDGTVYRLLQQRDGKILVGGSFSNLQGVARQGIGRLSTNGVVDLSFDARPLPGSEKIVFSMAIQGDEKILIGIVGNVGSNGELFRLNTNGQPDASFIQTNIFQNYHIFAICPRTNGSILVGGGFRGVNDFDTVGLALLDGNGQLDTNFTSQLETNSNPTSVIELADGSLLVGGGMWRKTATNWTVVAKLTSGLGWDSDFRTAAFDPAGIPAGYGYVFCILPVPDGKIILGGNFQDVGGFWRRGVVRIDSEGQVDPCFDPGLGLAPKYLFGAVALARQPDGKILVGGDFVGLVSDGADKTNIVRLLPQNECNAMRVYLRKSGDHNYFVGATCPPGGTNLFQVSSNLVDWKTMDTKTTPYFYFDYGFAEAPIAFFRVKKEQ